MVHAQQGAALMKHTILAIVRLTQVESHPALGRDLIPDPPEISSWNIQSVVQGEVPFGILLDLFLFRKPDLSNVYMFILYWPQRKNCTGFIKGVEEFSLDLIINLNNL